MANRGWKYPLGEDPNSASPKSLFEDCFGDEIVEGDEYWEIGKHFVLDDNLIKFTEEMLEVKVFEGDDEYDSYEYLDVYGELVSDGEVLNYIRDNFEMKVAGWNEDDF